METTTTTSRHVVVTTQHRGVFFGCLESESDGGKTVTLTGAQMCVYWSEDVRGVLGLAAGGPTRGCRVTAPVPRLRLSDVTAVMDAAAEAVTAWQDRPWS